MKAPRPNPANTANAALRCVFITTTPLYERRPYGTLSRIAELANCRDRHAKRAPEHVTKQTEGSVTREGGGGHPRPDERDGGYAPNRAPPQERPKATDLRSVLVGRLTMPTG